MLCAVAAVEVVAVVVVVEETETHQALFLKTTWKP